MIKMYKGQFVFIRDEFLNKYFPPIVDKDNRKNYINHGEGRPFFYVFDEDEDIAWVVPVTSDKEGKYRDKYNNYKDKETSKRPNWISLGKVDGVDSAFKLSGMFPVPKSEIDHVFYSKKYGFFPMKKIEAFSIIKIAIEYKKTNDNNLKLGLEEIIKSPYKEILQDIENSKEKPLTEIDKDDDFEL